MPPAELPSVLAPAGPDAEVLASVIELLLVGGAVTLLAVVVLIGWALLVAPERRRWLARERTVWIGGLALPLVTFTALGVREIGRTHDELARGADDPLVIDVVGEQWWWRVRYVGAAVETANEIRVPVGRDVELRLTTADVIHSFWVPRLAGKVDMVPGRENRLTLRAGSAGVFRGVCAEFCGSAHAQMALFVVAEPAREFASWIERQGKPAAEPVGGLAARGRDAFSAAGCGACHRIAGTTASGTLGPDLTHVGGRVSLGAGILPVHAGALAAWIASSQHQKPGNRMPSFTGFTGVELRAIATYLESLD